MKGNRYGGGFTIKFTIPKHVYYENIPHPLAHKNRKKNTLGVGDANVATT
jgi:hypothetical protein